MALRGDHQTHGRFIGPQETPGGGGKGQGTLELLRIIERWEDAAMCPGPCHCVAVCGCVGLCGAA
jgi:hypothetical protein